MRWIARACITAALLCAAPAARAEEAPPAAQPFMTVTYLSGEARVTLSGTPAPQDLHAGAQLREGDLVQTGERSRLEILLATGSIVRLGPRSRLELRTAPIETRSFSARLLFGNLWAKVNKLVARQRFEIETQNAVAGVRGTEFRIAAASSGESLLRVYEGTVEMRDHAGTWTHAVTLGKELRTGKSGSAGPKAFDAKHEKSSFMRWVRQKGQEPDKQHGERSHERPHIRHDVHKK